MITFVGTRRFGLPVVGKRCSLLLVRNDSGGKQELDNALRLVRLLASKPRNIQRDPASPSEPNRGTVGLSVGL